MIKKAAPTGKIDLDRRVGALARRQQGHVTRAQLLALGMTRHEIAYRLEVGWLIRVYAGVYAVGHLPVDPVAGYAAAVLACGPNAVLSHHTAAALWGFRKPKPGPIEVTDATAHRRRGIKAHRNAITRRETTRHRGILVTKPARTLNDIAPSLTEKQLIRAINDAILSNYLREADLEGTPLEGLVTGKSRSPLEDDFRPWLKRFHLPEPQYNVRVNGREVDVYYPEARLIVELDGFATHKTRFAFEDDRERDAHNLVNGLSTIRITRDRLTRAPAKEAERLTAILTARRITLTDF